MRTLVTASTVIVTLLAAPHVAISQTGNAPFCLKTMTGQLSCTYATMTQCEQARPSGSFGQCITRSDAGGTTGLGTTAVTPPGSPERPSPPER
jgi:Protein of unknown function (DUF3551)